MQPLFLSSSPDFLYCNLLRMLVNMRMLLLKPVLMLVFASASSALPHSHTDSQSPSSSTSDAASPHHVHSSAHHHECNYQVPDYVRLDPVTHDSVLHRMKRQSATNSSTVLTATPIPIRITTVIDTTISDAVAANIVLPAVKYYQDTLQIKYPLQTPLQITQTCANNVKTFSNPYRNGDPYCWQTCAATTYCGSYAIPPQFYAPCPYCNGSYSKCTYGPAGNSSFQNTDLVVFVVSISDSICTPTGSVAAYGTHCQMDSTGRSTVATINVCPKTVGGGGSMNIYGLQHTVLHELTHCLAFASGMFSLFLDSNGVRFQNSPLVSVMSPWDTINGTLYKNTTYLATPNVVQAVQKHFNCSSLPGAELEDQGGAGTALTHWEKRLFNNELMTGIYTETAYISNITLSLLQDTGWYNVNFSMAEDYTWGKGLGCRYATNSCMTWISSRKAQGLSTYPYCDQVSNKISWTASSSDIRTICDPIDNTTIRICNLQYYTSSTGALYKYFNYSLDNMPAGANPAQYGSSIAYADYCPYYMQHVLTLTSNPLSYYMACNDPSNGAVNNGVLYDLSMYGPGQKCVKQTSPSMAFTSSSGAISSYWGAGCYKVNCDANAVTVTICSTTFVCAYELQIISWNISCSRSLNFGQFSCPTCDAACPNSVCPMARANSSMIAAILKVSTTNETAYMNSLVASAKKYSGLPKGNETNSCPTNITVSSTATTTTIAPSTSIATSTQAAKINSIVSTVMDYFDGYIMNVCPVGSCLGYSSCAYLAVPYCRCNFPHYGDASVGCVQPNVQNNLLLSVQMTMSYNAISVPMNPFNSTVAELIIFDKVIDAALSQYSSVIPYLNTSATATSFSVANNSASVVVATHFAVNLTQQESVAPKLQSNVSAALTNWFRAAQPQACNFGYYTSNCSAINVTVKNMCSLVKCPDKTHCVLYGELYNCICNSGYLSIGYAASNALVENCMSYNSTISSNMTGPGVNCSLTPLGVVRCVCADGYIGSPSSRCYLTANSTTMAKVALKFTINYTMPSSLAEGSASYWSFILAMELHLDSAASSSSSNSSSYVNGSTKIGTVVNGSIIVNYQAAYQSTNGVKPDSALVHAANVDAVNNFYSQAALESADGTCSFGTIVTSCDRFSVSADMCSSGEISCPANTVCASAGNSYNCICAAGYVQVGFVDGSANIANCVVSSSDVSIDNVGTLLAIVLPCVLGILLVVVIGLVVYRVMQAKSASTSTSETNQKFVEQRANSYLPYPSLGPANR